MAANHNLYFTSETERVRSGQDILMAKYEHGKYLAPEELGPNADSSG